MALISKPSGRSDGWCSLFLARNLALLVGGGGVGSSLDTGTVPGVGDVTDGEEVGTDDML